MAKKPRRVIRQSRKSYELSDKINKGYIARQYHNPVKWVRIDFTKAGFCERRLPEVAYTAVIGIDQPGQCRDYKDTSDNHSINSHRIRSGS